MREKRRPGRRSRTEKRPARLPCGCDPEELATEMGVPLDVLLGAAAAAERGDGDAGELALLTFPLGGPFPGPLAVRPPPRTRGDPTDN